MRFWKEKSVEDTVIFGPTARATLVASNLFICPYYGPITYEASTFATMEFSETKNKINVDLDY